MAHHFDSRFVTVDGLRAHFVTPADATSGNAPAVLLLPMITGIGEQVREFAELIAGETGAIALTWDPWHGKSSDDTPFEELHELHAQLDDETVLDEQQRLVDYLTTEHGVSSVGVIGWCLGGRFALILGARDPRIESVVAYHPTLPGEIQPHHSIDAVAAAADIPAPVMVHYPGKDSLVPRENFLSLQAALQGRDTDAPTIIHLYPRAKHGFSDSRRHNEQVNADAWAMSWPQTLDFLRTSARLREPAV
ncbi:dienelactone hydrolase family protein [Rhodococcus sp. T7]|uniref:dienelactone hydrolase family protein n=1 Tax=Rhodococcus sp. T7 TaxID=627444 RepID=UPI0013CAE832|nr:dienelactone hydrolase family protein [Rhodococcus sp. T7]KAF0960341.1 hypothetical protein MLGJGCBP_06542 [Rhodococcus sp. T7]